MSSNHMIRPSQIDNIPTLDQNTKNNYKNGLTNLWNQYESAQEGPQKQEYKNKILTASQRIMQAISQRGKPGQSAQPRPPNGQQPPQPQTQQVQQNQPQQQMQQQAQGGDQDAAIKARITAEVSAMVIGPSPEVSNQQQFEQYKRDFKSQYGTFRLRLEKAKDLQNNLTRVVQQAQQNNQPVSDEIKNRFQQTRANITQLTNQLKTMSESNEKNVKNAQARRAQNGQPQPNVDMSQQRPVGQDSLNTSQQGQVGLQPGQNQQIQRPPSVQNPTAQTPKPLPQQTPMQQPQRPPINPQSVPQFSNQYPSAPNSAMPQSATSGTPQLPQPPRALSQQGAIAKAQEQQLQPQPQSAQPGQPPQPMQAQQQNLPNASAFNHQPQQQSTPTSAIPTSQISHGQKMPIPKTLELGPQSQTPVAGPPARPTMMSQGGMMGMPGVQKPPPFTLEGEGDHVLSKRKLDELVRQVTGSTNAADGLTPEVEELVLTLTDNFVDNVITKACQLAKLRPSQTLDIRDVQLVLERNYGIRIPGYSLDEVRTVRKFQPAPGWVQKVQAVQAGKVMGNNKDA